MARDCENWDWTIPPSGPGGTQRSFEGAQLAVLMDIRAELQKLNRLFACRNFLDMPQLLRDIKRNTAKPKKRKSRVK